MSDAFAGGNRDAIVKRCVAFVAGAAVLVMVPGVRAWGALCLRKNGVVVLRAGNCKKRERSITGADLGLVGGKGPPGDKGPSGDPGKPRVLNGDGQPIGILDMTGPSVAVRSPADGKWVVTYDVASTGFVDNGQVRLMHEQLACADPPLAGARIQAGNDLNVLFRIGSVSGGRIYYPGDPITTLASFQSVEQPNPNCTAPDFVTSRGLCCSNQGGSFGEGAGPAVAIDASTFGAGPFTLDF